MKILNFITWLFLLPGDVVRKYAGISIDEDGGILRSFVNMIVWGILISVIVFKVLI